METTAQKPPLPWYVRAIAGKNPLITLVRAALWALLLVILFKFVLVGIRVKGESMEPTFHEGQVKFVNRLAYFRTQPKRGDVVAVRAPGLRAVFLKRIIGLPGEHVLIQRGLVYIDGQRLEEPYAKGLIGPLARPEFDLEPHEYWVIGDNRAISEQWRKFDYSIIGKLIY
jgi:signal peptidase I